MVIVSREPDGRWYVTFTIHAPGPEPLPAAGRAAGVDLGVKDFAVTSGGERIANPRHLERKARRLARYQRRLARCQRGSANRAKAAGPRSPAPTARSATPAGTSCTAPAPAWSARRTRS
jgi:putative transposase